MNVEKKPGKFVSIMCFNDELCQVFNALMTALSLLSAVRGSQSPPPVAGN